MSGQKEWLSDKSEGTSTSLKMDCNDTEMKFGFSDSKMSFEAERNLCEGDWKAEMEVEADWKPSKTEWEAQGKVKFESPDFSGSKLWCNLALTHGSADPSAWELEKRVNISYEDEYHFGFKVKHDMAALTAGWMQLVNTPKGKEDCAFWLRGDMNQKLASIGAAYKYDWEGCPTWHSWEAAASN